MKYLSICSGIEAASVAFGPLGWKPLAFSEIEAFPRAVLKHHYPDTPCHGDFTLLKDEPWIVDADIICGGTPCQAFSVAGLRQSLADDRGNLTLQFVLLADAIDHLRSNTGREPAWILWENVPGVLSTKDNAFGAFLGGLVGRTSPIPEPADGWTGAGVVDGPTRCAAWRTLNAEHFGLAQRRKRVFVLAKGGAGRWAAADALLPIIESGRWHPAPSRGKGKVAPTIPARSSAGGGLGTDFDCDGGLIPEVAGTMKACAQSGGFSNSIDHAAAGYMVPVIAHTLRGEGFDASEDGTGRGIPLVLAHGQANAEVVSDGSPSLTCNHEAPIVFDPAQVTSVANRSNPQPGDPCHTLHQGEAPMLVRMREGKEGGGKGPLVSEDQVLAFKGGQGSGAGSLGASEYVSPTLGAADSGSNRTPTLMHGMQVRRLTPAECERLQGFPDGYTNIPWRGKPESPDGNRYKALGNSWAVPCARWIGERIKAIGP